MKVTDHNHITGKYRGFAYSSCNLNFQLSKKILAIFHNTGGYISHLIMQGFGNGYKCYTK